MTELSSIMPFLTNNMMLPKPLLDDIAKGLCLPFIGAGFSINAELSDGKQMPTWNEIGVELSKDLDDTDKHQTTDPLGIASAYEKKFGRPTLLSSIRNLLFIDSVKPGEVHKKFSRLPFDVVYTTNYDTLLEDGFRATTNDSKEVGGVRPYRVLVGDKSLSHYGGPAVTNIIKIHGDFLNLDELVITDNDYSRFLQDHPIISNHLMTMLTIKTPLFIGYSLSDPHLRQLMQIIKNLLKEFTRKSFIIIFDASKETIKELEPDFIVINLVTKGKTRKQLILELLDEVLDYITVRNAQAAINRSGREIQEEDVKNSVKNNNVIPLLETTGNFCIVSSPVTPDSQTIIRRSLRPAIEKYGLRTKRSNELTMSLPIIEEIKTTILQSKLLISDITSKNDFVMYELSLAIENKKNIIIISQNKNTSHIPTNYPIITYSLDNKGLEDLRSEVEKNIEKLLFLNPPSIIKNHIQNQRFSLAIILSFSYLENVLNNLLYRIRDTYPGANETNLALDTLVELKIISSSQREDLKNWSRIRNKTIHQGISPDKDSIFIANEVVKLAEFLSSNTGAIVDWAKYFSPDEKTEIVTSFVQKLEELSSEFIHQDKGRIFLDALEVFREMGKKTIGEVLVPILVRVGETQGEIVTQNNGKEIGIK